MVTSSLSCVAQCCLRARDYRMRRVQVRGIWFGIDKSFGRMFVEDSSAIACEGLSRLVVTPLSSGLAFQIPCCTQLNDSGTW